MNYILLTYSIDLCRVETAIDSTPPLPSKKKIRYLLYFTGFEIRYRSCWPSQMPLSNFVSKRWLVCLNSVGTWTHDHAHDRRSPYQLNHRGLSHEKAWALGIYQYPILHAVSKKGIRQKTGQFVVRPFLLEPLTLPHCVGRRPWLCQTLIKNFGSSYCTIMCVIDFTKEQVPLYSLLAAILEMSQINMPLFWNLLNT